MLDVEPEPLSDAGDLQRTRNPGVVLRIGPDEIRRLVRDKVRIEFQPADVFGLGDRGVNIVFQPSVAVL